MISCLEQVSWFSAGYLEWVWRILNEFESWYPVLNFTCSQNFCFLELISSNQRVFVSQQISINQKQYKCGETERSRQVDRRWAIGDEGATTTAKPKSQPRPAIISALSSGDPICRRPTRHDQDVWVLWTWTSPCPSIVMTHDDRRELHYLSQGGLWTLKVIFMDP